MLSVIKCILAFDQAIVLCAHPLAASTWHFYACTVQKGSVDVRALFHDCLETTILLNVKYPDICNRVGDMQPDTLAHTLYF